MSVHHSGNYCLGNNVQFGTLFKCVLQSSDKAARTGSHPNPCRGHPIVSALFTVCSRKTIFQFLDDILQPVVLVFPSIFSTVSAQIPR